MKLSIEQLQTKIAKKVDESYIRGYVDALQELCDKYLIKVWHKEQAEEFMDSIIRDIEIMSSVRYNELRHKFEEKYGERYN